MIMLRRLVGVLKRGEGFADSEKEREFVSSYSETFCAVLSSLVNGLREGVGWLLKDMGH